jgi:hypothetical protein
VLYDWRVVIIRAGIHRELEPTTVEEVEIGRTSITRQADDVDMDGIADGEVLAWDSIVEQLVKTAPGDLAIDDTDWDKVLSGATPTVAGLATAVDEHKHDADYVSVIASPVAGDFPEMTAGGELSASGYGPGDFEPIRQVSAGTKSGFNLTGTAFDIASWTVPGGQQGDGGHLHVQVTVKDATDDKAQSLTTDWTWDVARRTIAVDQKISQRGSPTAADPSSGTLTVVATITSGLLKLAVTSSISGGSAPVGSLVWWLTGKGVVIWSPA